MAYALINGMYFKIYGLYLRKMACTSINGLNFKINGLYIFCHSHEKWEIKFLTVFDACKVASLPHWLTLGTRIPKIVFFATFLFWPIIGHIGHLIVMVDQFYTGWSILRPKNRSQAEISKIVKMAILADFDNFWAFLSNLGLKSI